jgi:hypothetical protein
MTDIPAFPFAWQSPITDKTTINQGMMLRDYFAAAAMPVLVANFLAKDLDATDPHGWMEGLSMDAYAMADAMIKERKAK